MISGITIPRRCRYSASRVSVRIFFFSFFFLFFFFGTSHVQRTLAVGVRCYASYFHARTQRLHLLKAIHYDSKIISFDSSRQRRGRHPIKSYVAAPETTIRTRRASLYISLVRTSCVPVVYIPLLVSSFPFSFFFFFFYLHFFCISSQRSSKPFNLRNSISPSDRDFVERDEEERNSSRFSLSN